MTQVAGSIVTIDLNTAPTAQEALAQYDREHGLEPRIVMPTYNTMMTERRNEAKNGQPVRAGFDRDTISP